LNKNFILYLIILLISAFSFLITGTALIPIILSLSFFRSKRLISMVLGFLTGFISSITPLLAYSLYAVIKISELISSVIGLNQILLILAFPLIVGMASMLTAALGTQIYLILIDLRSKDSA
jgi:hypothetical protein